MKILIKNAKILDKASSFFNKTVDILIENGVITKINKDISEEDAELISIDNLHISQGWVDLKAHFCDPGEEHKETIESGLNAAAFGGYTHVFSLPSTNPVVDNKSQVLYQINNSDYHAVDLHPIGAISEGLKGKNLAELYDLYTAGVRQFSDDEVPLNSGIAYRALLYIKNFGGKIISFPQDVFLANGSFVNEGVASTLTGMKANPTISETIQLNRDIRLLEYTDSFLHVTGISCSESLDLIRAAKAKGLNITCDVHVNHLIFNENDVIEFDSNHKVNPPYRRESDRIALWEGLKDGTIDAIVSNHRPKDKEEKDVEFDNAHPGNITLQTLFASLKTVKEFDLQTVINKLSIDNRKTFDLASTPIEVGNEADLTLFNPSKKWCFSKDIILSSSFNSPFIDKELEGLSLGIINKNKWVLNEI